MMFIFWVEYWVAMMRPVPVRPVATVIDLAQWRREHPKRGAA
jgi:hypothetical protein